MGVPADTRSHLGRLAYLALVPSAVLLACFLITSLLVSLRVEEAVVNLAEVRARLVAGEVRRAVEAGLRFGIQLTDQSGLPRQLTEQLRGDPDVQAITVYSDTAQPVFREARPAEAVELEPRFARRLLDESAVNPAEDIVRTFRSGGQQHVVMSIRDPIGRPGGLVSVMYADPAATATFVAVMKRLLPATGISWLAGTAVCIALAALMWGRWERASAAVIHRLRGTPTADDGMQRLAGLKLDGAVKSIETAETELDRLSRFAERRPDGLS